MATSGSSGGPPSPAWGERWLTAASRQRYTEAIQYTDCWYLQYYCNGCVSQYPAQYTNVQLMGTWFDVLNSIASLHTWRKTRTTRTHPVPTWYIQSNTSPTMSETGNIRAHERVLCCCSLPSSFVYAVDACFLLCCSFCVWVQSPIRSCLNSRIAGHYCLMWGQLVTHY